MSCCEIAGLIFTRTCPSHSLCLITLPLSEHPWKILCACVDLKFQLLNCYKLKLWLAAFSPEAGKNMLWCWPLGGEREVVSDICLLLCVGPHFCLTMSLAGHCTSPAVCCSVSWGMPIQYYTVQAVGKHFVLPKRSAATQYTNLLNHTLKAFFLFHNTGVSLVFPFSPLLV